MSFICFNTSILIGGIGIAKGEKSDAEDLFKKAFVIQLWFIIPIYGFTEAFVRLQPSEWTIKSFSY